MNSARRWHDPAGLRGDSAGSVKSNPPTLYAAAMRAEASSEAQNTAFSPGISHAAQSLGKPAQSGVFRRPTENKTRSSAAWVVREESRLEFFAFDASYVEKLRLGDAQTEAHFVQYFSELIRLKLRSRLNSREAIEDVRQETFMRVLALLRGQGGGLRQADRLGPFVNSVCNHVLQEHYRSRKRMEGTIDEETEATLPGREPSALSQLETKEAQRVVRQILNAMPERDRRLIQSVLLDERDKDEICAEFGITREYLRVLLHRAKQSFKSFYVDQVGSR
jgi:RNA polymerase sigma-70 factor, ECF subfamily